MKRVYIASPYTRLAKINKCLPLRVAQKHKDLARGYYENKEVELFSPVLELSQRLKDLSYDEAMQECYKELEKCQELFITKNMSQGMWLEYQFAKEKGIKIVLAQINDDYFYKERLFDD